MYRYDFYRKIKIPMVNDIRLFAQINIIQFNIIRI